MVVNKKIRRLILAILLGGLLAFLGSCILEDIISYGSCNYGLLGTLCKETTESECDDLGGFWIEDGTCE